MGVPRSPIKRPSVKGEIPPVEETVYDDTMT
jgi:hypothetical protein